MVLIGTVYGSDSAADMVREAERLARAFGDTVHFVHALTRSEFVDLGRTNAQDGEPLDMDQIREAAAEIAEESVVSADVPYETVGLVGDPATEIVEYADEQDARYIVVSPRRRSPAGKALFGSVAQSILLEANCPVVTYVGES